ncbi:MAG: hypothetical protein ACYS22_17645, partial [Planctomycetota bacterium]
MNRIPSTALVLTIGMLFAPIGCSGGSSSSDSAFLSAPALVSPPAGTSGLETSPALRWEDPLPLQSGPVVYDLEIATTSSFASVTERAIGLTGTTYRPTRLTAGETYFWRVRARAP